MTATRRKFLQDNLSAADHKQYRQLVGKCWRTGIAVVLTIPLGLATVFLLITSAVPYEHIATVILLCLAIVVAAAFILAIRFSNLLDRVVTLENRASRHAAGK